MYINLIFTNNHYYYKIDRQFGKESLSSFIEKKREMFLLQYSLGVKRDEIKKLEDIIQVQ